MQRWNRCEKVFGVHNVWGREVKWSYQTGDYVISSPTVANGVVYVSSAASTCTLNASTGAKRWRYKTGNSVQSSPAVVNGVVYVSSRDGNVCAFGLK
jgi:eukaryotic-like serine/threonine-protein kinase